MYWINKKLVMRLLLIGLSLVAILGLYVLLFRRYGLSSVWSGVRAFTWHPDVRQEYMRLVRSHGLPDHSDMSPGGLAEWHRRGIFACIRIEDRPVQHCCPKPHYDYVSASVEVDIRSPQKMGEVMSISESVWYDQLKGQLWARCNFMGANVATLLLACKVILGQSTPTLAHQKYPERVRSAGTRAGYSEQLGGLHRLVEVIGHTPTPKECPMAKRGECFSRFFDA